MILIFIFPINAQDLSLAEEHYGFLKKTDNVKLDDRIFINDMKK